MDKRVMLAVAGSGKTTYLVQQLNENDPVLIVTYTISNYENIRKAIIRKFGHFPKNIYLDTYFSFLYSFCIRPLLNFNDKISGLFFEINPNLFARGDARFLTSTGKLYANRAAKFIDHRGLGNELKVRIEKYFKVIYIDEVQDFGGNDFNFLKFLCSLDTDILMVGDFYQHTFDTSRDGNVNGQLYDNIENYEAEFTQIGLTIDKATLMRSRRCSHDICSFISDKLGIAIESERPDKTEITLIESVDEAKSILANPEIVKLFYQEHYRYWIFRRKFTTLPLQSLPLIPRESLPMVAYLFH